MDCGSCAKASGINRVGTRVLVESQVHRSLPRAIFPWARKPDPSGLARKIRMLGSELSHFSLTDGPNSVTSAPSSQNRPAEFDGSQPATEANAVEAERDLLKLLPGLATPREVAKVLRCSPRYIGQECRSGRLAASFIAGRYLISREAVFAYLRSRSTCPDGTAALTSRGDQNAAPGSSIGMKRD